jgi:hypothetical protein
LTEFGGIAFTSPERRDETWGYARSETVEDFAARYADLLETVRSLPLLAGFCYTQFADCYQEANGLLYADRTPKFPLPDIARATSGRVPALLGSLVDTGSHACAPPILVADEADLVATRDD